MNRKIVLTVLAAFLLLGIGIALSEQAVAQPWGYAGDGYVWNTQGNWGWSMWTAYQMTPQYFYGYSWNAQPFGPYYFR